MEGKTDMSKVKTVIKISEIKRRNEWYKKAREFNVIGKIILK